MTATGVGNIALLGSEFIFLFVGKVLSIDWLGSESGFFELLRQVSKSAAGILSFYKVTLPKDRV